MHEARIRPEPQAEAPAPSHKRLRVIVADDHDQLRRSICRMLRHRVDIIGEARDGSEAVQLARELNPDVILMDVRMPRMNGIEATRSIKTEMPQIRIVGHSAFDERELVEEMVNAGAEHYLIKGASSMADFIAGLGESGPEPAIPDHR